MEYSDPNLGFKINYPAGSSVDEHPNGVVFGVDGGDSLAVSISVINDINMQLNEFTDLTINQLRQDFPGFHVIDSSDTTLAGYPAHLLLYEYNDDGTPFRVAGYWAVINNVAYKIMTITVPPLPDNLVDIAIEMAGSFHIIQGEGSQLQGPEFNQPPQSQENLGPPSTTQPGNFLEYLGF